MLENVEWGKFAFKSIFNKIAQGRRLKKEDQLSGNIPFVMAGVTNTGVVNYVSNPVATFPKNSITVDIFGNVFYRDYDFGAGDDTGVYWNSERLYSKETMLFFTIAMKKALQGKYSYGKKLRSSQSFNFQMYLPIKDNEIYFDFMDRFIAELEVQRITELETQRATELKAYLTVTGLQDYILTDEEQQALEAYKNIKWAIFNIEKLFGKSTRGKRLKSADRIPGNLPFVTAGETNEGISDFIGNDVTIFSANTTTIDMFGSAKYRNYEYGGDDHIAVVHTERLPKYAAIFVTAAIHKSSHCGKFDYSQNFYAKDADELDILLPVKNNQPDYEIMENIVAAIQKLVIKEVVEYADREITATKEVVNRKK